MQDFNAERWGRLYPDGDFFCHPDTMLADLLPEPLPVNSRGHTPIDDFEHFCNYSGLSVKRAGPIGFAYAKLAYCTAWLDRLEREATFGRN
ncbi:hypothetical protein [Paraburkholderia sp. Tr-20389]|uniref:hypothetical protein n=1 Tax=Paraburkholderia sp. Tr-20389 TaxID=2703903 RepID=UPI001F11BDE5|nr:hypothetical protein [Paraburkholderia sp. Tr-20389]